MIIRANEQEKTGKNTIQVEWNNQKCKANKVSCFNFLSGPVSISIIYFIGLCQSLAP